MSRAMEMPRSKDMENLMLVNDSRNKKREEQAEWCEFMAEINDRNKLC